MSHPVPQDFKDNIAAYKDLDTVESFVNFYGFACNMPIGNGTVLGLRKKFYTQKLLSKSLGKFYSNIMGPNHEEYISACVEAGLVTTQSVTVAKMENLMKIMKGKVVDEKFRQQMKSKAIQASVDKFGVTAEEVRFEKVFDSVCVVYKVAKRKYQEEADEEIAALEMQKRAKIVWLQEKHAENDHEYPLASNFEYPSGLELNKLCVNERQSGNHALNTVNGALTEEQIDLCVEEEGPIVIRRKKLAYIGSGNNSEMLNEAALAMLRDFRAYRKDRQADALVLDMEACGVAVPEELQVPASTE